ncbi:MAG TPA: HDOD domain-containing protein [Thermomicrobiales bacterium]|nr:HDOD domain-containing protein [Thermomicrobiales bacterium]
MQDKLGAQITADIHQLESLPAVVIEALDQLSRPDVNLRQVANVIGQDAVITARMMSIANSVYYRRGAAVHRLSDALVRLGIAMVKEVLLTASVMGVMDRKLTGYQLDRGQLYRHSVATAIGARILAQHTNYPYREEAYIAGLLHDIGKLIFDRYLRDHYEAVIEFSTTNQVPFVEAEARILGYDHAQIGGLVIASWELPARFVEAVSTHHSPSAARDFPELAFIVHLANAFTLTLGVDVGGDGLMSMVEAKAISALHLDAHKVERIIAEMAEAVKRAGLEGVTAGESEGSRALASA